MSKLGFLLAGAIMMASIANTADARTLRVGSECTYPPFNYRNADGKLEGFDIDIAREIGKRIGTELEFVCQAWDGMIPALLAGKFDLIVASMSITAERLKSIDFSVPYRSSTGRFVGRSDVELDPFTAGGAPDPESLEGKIVGIQRASTYDSYLTTEFAGVELARYDTIDNMLLDLQAGRVDLVMSGPIKLSGFLNKPEGEPFSFVGPEVEDVDYFGPGVGVGIRKGEDALLKDINGALETMFADGDFKDINKKYWSFTVLPAAWTE